MIQANSTSMHENLTIRKPEHPKITKSERPNANVKSNIYAGLCFISYNLHVVFIRQVHFAQLQALDLNGQAPVGLLECFLKFQLAFGKTTSSQTDFRVILVRMPEIEPKQGGSALAR